MVRGQNEAVKGAWRGRNGEGSGWGRADCVWEAGGFSSQVLSSFLDPVVWCRSTWPCAGDFAGACLSRPLLSPQRLNPGKGTNVPLSKRDLHDCSSVGCSGNHFGAGALVGGGGWMSNE